MLPLTRAAATDYAARRAIRTPADAPGAHGWSPPHATNHPPHALRGVEHTPIHGLFPRAGAIARFLTYDTNQSVMLYIDERGIWSSSEDTLVLSLLRARGGLGPLTDDLDGHPALLVMPHESAELASLLSCRLCGGMGFLACSSHGDRAVRINHDGHGWLSGNDHPAAERLAAFLNVDQ